MTGRSASGPGSVTRGSTRRFSTVTAGIVTPYGQLRSTLARALSRRSPSQTKLENSIFPGAWRQASGAKSPGTALERQARFQEGQGLVHAVKERGVKAPLGEGVRGH